MVKYTEYEENYQCQTKINQRLYILRKQEQIFRYIHLGEYPSVHAAFDVYVGYLLYD